MDRYTDYQRQVIHLDTGRSIVCAAAGSGKTSVLVERAIRLCSKGEPVLTLAYNTDAAAEIRRRFEHPMHHVFTFHAYALALLRMQVPSLPIVAEKLLVSATIKENHRLRRHSLTWEEAKAICDSWSYEAETMIPFSNRELRDAVNIAVKGFAFYRLIKAITSIDPAKLALADFFHVQIDEAQDATKARWHIVDALSANCKSLLVVGDPRQSIYSFQGAAPYLFVKRWHNMNQYSLPHNWRSGQAIVEWGNEVCKGKTWNIGEAPIAGRNINSRVLSTKPDVEVTRLCRTNVVSKLYRGRTVHSAKGLEFENVQVIEDEFKLNTEEETRLAYVAGTRAIQNLYLPANWL